MHPIGLCRLLAIVVIMLVVLSDAALARQKGPLFTPIFPSLVNAVSVSLDTQILATLGHANFDIVLGTSGGGTPLITRSTDDVQELSLPPGAYTLRAPAGGGAGAVTLSFTVNADCDLSLP